MDRNPPAHADPATPGAPGAERRERLRQFQAQLIERVQAARSGTATGVRELGVTIGARHYLLDLTQIGEIVMPQPVAPVPLARPWYLGLANIRGDLTGVIDLARYLGQPGPADADAGADTDLGAAAAAGDGAATAEPARRAALAERRLITFSPRLGFNCALLADRVLGLRTSSAMRAVSAPVLEPAGAEPAAPSWARRCFDDADDRRWTLLDLAQLVREPRFAQVGF
ncbi:type IV pili signal transduction protein [Duganella sp. Leaf126]|uniref:chemotaxis protein CheW n=1 Tax=Duganella sp. Leaf126 TaxID=1736266 RepID=UPI0006F67667|nr:chemotaxis protein CheW [Duganella sp. Leaf126]KQQ47319.1 type IV pili signal transduction protein [Duganella sp. Leaf126]